MDQSFTKIYAKHASVAVWAANSPTKDMPRLTIHEKSMTPGAGIENTGCVSFYRCLTKKFSAHT